MSDPTISQVDVQGDGGYIWSSRSGLGFIEGKDLTSRSGLGFIEGK